MANNKENKHSFASLMLVFIIFGTLAILVFVPVELLEKVRNVEQESVIRWLGKEADQWVMEKIFIFLQEANNEIQGNLTDADMTGNAMIDAWFIKRLYATLLWLHVVIYRIGVLGMWFIFAIPVIVGAISDGYLKREISKANFSSQSPVMHKYGMDTFKGILLLLLGWIIIPWHITMLSAPFGILIMSMSIWTWISNAPKRI